jgi:hypothetical protein
MTEYEEIYDDEKIEKDNVKSMRELSKYTKILNKENNLSFILKNFHQIKLKNSKSLFKISMLMGNLPEENVSFTFYDEEEDEQSEVKNSKKNILRASKKPKPIKTNIYFTNKIKDSVAQEIYKNGNIIGYNHSLFRTVWVNLYKFTLMISSIGLIALFIYSMIIIKEQKYLILGADGLSLISLILMIYTSISGNNKMQSKRKVNFRKENWLLLSFILMDISCLVYWGYLKSDKSIGLYLFILICAYFIFGLLLIMSILLIYLNIKMIEFYKEYHKNIEEGTLLIEVK